MNKTAQRALRATAAFAGLATAFGTTGTALAASPAGEHLAEHTAPAEAGAATAGMSAPTAAPSVNDMHSFALPSSAPARHGHSHDQDGGGPERQSNSNRYRKGDGPGYNTNRSSNKALKRAESNHHYGARECHNSSTVYGYGYNGNRHSHKPNSDDYNPGCDGYHADKGANRYDNDNYEGTDDSRRNDKDYQFGGLV